MEQDECVGAIADIPQGRVLLIMLDGSSVVSLDNDAMSKKIEPTVGDSRKAVCSPGFGFHLVSVNWSNIQTPSWQHGKKLKERAMSLGDPIESNLVVIWSQVDRVEDSQPAPLSGESDVVLPLVNE